jgi:lysyl-tRNA synthetase class 2
MENDKQAQIDRWRNLDSEQMKVRIEKKNVLESKGLNPYKNNFKPNVTSVELQHLYEAFTKEELEAKNLTNAYAIAGRALTIRSFGKAAFVQLDDGKGKIQIYIKNQEMDAPSNEEFKLIDYGDIIGVVGKIFKTNKGELSLHATSFTILTKSLRPLPEKFHGLADIEMKYRMRYLDFIMSEESREIFKKRAKIIQFIRKFFNERDYLEVETPMLHSLAGGATARPFTTHHNSLGMDMFLRIAPELHLKRLIAGGFPKVFEMNRCFRNEGLSLKHNPEFTSIEFYEAYSTYEDLILLTEKLFAGLVNEVHASDTIKFGENEISFATPFRRFTIKESVMEVLKLSHEQLNSTSHLQGILQKKGFEEAGLAKLSLDRLQVLCFEEFVEGTLIQPTFITEYPTEISPLSRRNEANPAVVDRFELFINGWEVANAFSELNNPFDQLDRFALQAELKAQGDSEACDVDYDYVRALEFGMPPTAGEGIGIDRLCMLLTNSKTIRDVIMFPQMKKENFFGGMENHDQE